MSFASGMYEPSSDKGRIVNDNEILNSSFEGDWLKIDSGEFVEEGPVAEFLCNVPYTGISNIIEQDGCEAE